MNLFILGEVVFTSAYKLRADLTHTTSWWIWYSIYRFGIVYTECIIHLLVRNIQISGNIQLLRGFGFVYRVYNPSACE